MGTNIEAAAVAAALGAFAGDVPDVGVMTIGIEPRTERTVVRAVVDDAGVILHQVATGQTIPAWAAYGAKAVRVLRPDDATIIMLRSWSGAKDEFAERERTALAGPGNKSAGEIKVASETLALLATNRSGQEVAAAGTRLASGDIAIASGSGALLRIPGRYKVTHTLLDNTIGSWCRLDRATCRSNAGCRAAPNCRMLTTSQPLMPPLVRDEHLAPVTAVDQIAQIDGVREDWHSTGGWDHRAMRSRLRRLHIDGLEYTWKAVVRSAPSARWAAGVAAFGFGCGAAARPAVRCRRT